MSIEIERIDAGSPDALAERLIERDAPAIINGVVGEEARRAWSLTALRAAAGERPVSVAKSDTATFDFNEEGEPRHSALSLTLADALDLIARAPASGPFYYIRRAPLSDLGLPATGLLGASLARGTKKTHTLWLGSAGCVTPLHYDSECNLLTHLHGTKEVTLFPPTEHRLMYPYEMSRRTLARKTFLYSRVDPEAFDEKLFPGFPTHLRIKFELKPGDALYLPPFWWHRVRSREVAVSANLFWWLRPRQTLVEASVDYLRLRYQRDTFANFFEDAGEQERPLHFTRLAAEAEERGLTCAAAMFCGACVRLTLRALSGAHLAATTTTDAGVADLAEALAGSGVINAEEAREALRWTLLADFAAQTGKSPRASEVEAMLAGVRAFVSKYLARTDAPAPVSIEA